MRPCSAVTICFLALVQLTGLAQTGKESTLFPFVLPWDDATPGVVNLSGWLPKPAGKFGQVRAEGEVRGVL